MARLQFLPATLDNRGPLAQLVEQGTLNPKVEGSSPSRPTLSRSHAEPDGGLLRCLSGPRVASGGNRRGNKPECERPSYLSISSARARGPASTLGRTSPRLGYKTFDRVRPPPAPLSRAREGTRRTLRSALVKSTSRTACTLPSGPLTEQGGAAAVGVVSMILPARLLARTSAVKET